MFKYEVACPRTLTAQVINSINCQKIHEKLYVKNVNNIQIQHILNLERLT